MTNNENKNKNPPVHYYTYTIPVVQSTVYTLPIIWLLYSWLHHNLMQALIQKYIKVGSSGS